MIDVLFHEFSKRKKDIDKDKIELTKLNWTEDLTITTDQNRLNQIFINLLTNSMKFTENGSIHFGIEKTDNKFVHFIVKDTGIGISNEMHNLIFDRFRQGEDNTTRQYGGNGLGLSIVKNLIEIMGGKISLESELGKGATLRFSITFEP